LRVQAVHFLDRPDGYLIPDLELRGTSSALFADFKPDVLVTCDPQTLFTAFGINIRITARRAGRARRRFSRQRAMLATFQSS